MCCDSNSAHTGECRVEIMIFKPSKVVFQNVLFASEKVWDGLGCRCLTRM